MTEQDYSMKSQANLHKELTTHFEENYDRLVKRASFRVGGMTNAEDVVQEAFTRALQYSASFEYSNRELTAWFNTILNNAASDLKSELRREGMSVASETPELEKVVLDHEILALVDQDMKEMGSAEEMVLKLYLVLDYTAKEVAAVTRYTPTHVRTRVNLFVHRMREKYDESLRS